MKSKRAETPPANRNLTRKGRGILTRGRGLTHWWSQRWIDCITQLGDPSRIRRGRTYIRQGRILNVAVVPGMIEARVRGSRREPYRVRVWMHTLDPVVLGLLTGEVWDCAFVPAYILAGQMPPGFEALMTERGVRLFPESEQECRFYCGCPEGTHFCKHIAAVLCLMGELFDQDPLLFLSFRGMGRDTLLERGVRAFEARSRKEGAVVPGKVSCEAELSGGEAVPMDASFFGDRVVLPCGMPAAEIKTEGAFSLLSDSPLWRNTGNFHESMSGYYQAVMEYARKLEKNEEEPERS